jgi:hypothetical protein
VSFAGAARAARSSWSRCPLRSPGHRPGHRGPRARPDPAQQPRCPDGPACCHSPSMATGAADRHADYRAASPHAQAHFRDDRAGCRGGPARCPDRRPARRSPDDHALRPGPEEPRLSPELHPRRLHGLRHLTSGAVHHAGRRDRGAREMESALLRRRAEPGRDAAAHGRGHPPLWALVLRAVPRGVHRPGRPAAARP